MFASNTYVRTYVRTIRAIDKLCDVYKKVEL